MDIQDAMRRFDEMWMTVDMSYDRYAKDRKMTGPSVFVIHILEDMGECTQRQLCEMMRMPRQSVNSIVMGFVEKGIVELAGHETDKRQKLIRLTPAGKQFASGLLPPIRKAERAALEQFTAGERDAFLELFGRYVQVLSANMK